MSSPFRHLFPAGRHLSPFVSSMTSPFVTIAACHISSFVSSITSAERHWSIIAKQLSACFCRNYL
jgi:hypothetical protein